MLAEDFNRSSGHAMYAVDQEQQVCEARWCCSARHLLKLLLMHARPSIRCLLLVWRSCESHVHTLARQLAAMEAMEAACAAELR